MKNPQRRSTALTEAKATRSITMVDGRVYTSDDGWATVRLNGRIVGKDEADLVRFLVAHGAAE